MKTLTHLSISLVVILFQSNLIGYNDDDIQQIDGTSLLDHADLFLSLKNKIFPTFGENEISKPVFILACDSPGELEIFVLFKTTATIGKDVFSRRKDEFSLFVYRKDQKGESSLSMEIKSNQCVTVCNLAFDSIIKSDFETQYKKVPIGEYNEFWLFASELSKSGELKTNLRVGHSINPSESGIVYHLKKTLNEWIRKGGVSPESLK